MNKVQIERVAAKLYETDHIDETGGPPSIAFDRLSEDSKKRLRDKAQVLICAFDSAASVHEDGGPTVHLVVAGDTLSCGLHRHKAKRVTRNPWRVTCRKCDNGSKARQYQAGWSAAVYEIHRTMNSLQSLPPSKIPSSVIEVK